MPPLRTTGGMLKELGLSQSPKKRNKGTARCLCYPEHRVYETLGARLLGADLIGQNYLAGRTAPLHFVGPGFIKSMDFTLKPNLKYRLKEPIYFHLAYNPVTDNGFHVIRTTIVLTIIVGTVIAVQEPWAASLIFRTGYEANTRPVNSVLRNVRGSDKSVAAPNRWESDLEGHPAIDEFGIRYVCGNDSERWAQIVDDPTNPGNRVMHFWLNDTQNCGAVSRIQAIIKTNHKLTEAFQRIRMYIHPDASKLLDSTGRWFQFQEIWIRPNWTGRDNPFRMGLYIPIKDGAYYWNVRATECCDPSIHFWNVENHAVPVPIGEWFTAETYYKMGDAKTGRIQFTITRDGQTPQTVFDVTNWTYHPDEQPEGIHIWNPQKLYVAPRNVDHVREKGGTLQIYWDDWELWDGLPPG